MDRMQATPRGAISGLLADAMFGGLNYMKDPRRTQQMQGLAAMLESTGVPAVVDRISYGEPLTTGRGMTTKLRPEAENTLMAALGMTPVGKPAQAGAMALGRAGERVAERVVPQVMERGGLPAEMLSAMAQGTQSPAARAGSKTADALTAAKNAQSIVREGNPIQSAVVLIGDKIFTGRTHTDAFNRAIYEGVIRRDGGKFIYPKDAEINSDLFMTKDGQIIDRLQASKMFDIGASETAIQEGLMQNKPASSMGIDSYIRQAEAIKKQREEQQSNSLLRMLGF